MGWKTVGASMRQSSWLGFFLSVVLVSCTRKPPEKLIVVLSNGSDAVAGMEVFLNGTRIGVSDAGGRVQFDFGKNQSTHLLLSVKPLDEKSVFMSQVLSADMPLAYFPEPFVWKVQVSALPRVAESSNAGNIASAFSREEKLEQQTAQSGDEVLLQEPSGPKVSEADLPLETSPIAAPTLAPVTATAAPLASLASLATPHPSKDEEVQKLEILVRDGEKPVGGAQVFASRAATRFAVLLGSTGADGALVSSLPKSLRMEQVLVRHDCCKPVLRPVTGAGKISLDLEKGFGAEFVLQNDAFGISRAVAGTEVVSNGARLDVGGQIGLVVLSAEQLRSESVELINKEALPESFSVRVSKSKKEPIKPIFRYAGLKKMPHPTVALLETGFEAGAQNSGDNLLWRKFRREFQGRFVQSQVFRPMISSDVENLAASVKLSPESLLSGGWEFSILNGEIDFLAEIRFEKDPKRFVVRLVNRSGVELFRETFEHTPVEPPEKSGAKAFLRLVEALPFEATVVEVKPDMFFANMSGEGSRGLEKNQFVDVYGWPEGDTSKPRNVWIATGKISGIEPQRIQVHITHKTKDFKGAVVTGMRVVRVSSAKRNAKTGERLP
jgi:hypothetical protein